MIKVIFDVKAHAIIDRDEGMVEVEFGTRFGMVLEGIENVAEPFVVEKG